MGKRHRNRETDNEQQESTGEAHIEQTGVVTHSVNGILTVELETGQVVFGHLGGKIRQHKINIVPGDRVLIKLSPYDLSRGIISRRI